MSARCRRFLTAIAFALAAALPFDGAGAATSAAPSADDPLVHVVIHLMLRRPEPVDGSSDRSVRWFCAPDERRFRSVPAPEHLLRSYGATLRRFGVVRDQFGPGTWTVGSAPAAAVSFELGDHVDVQTRLSQARRFLPAFLHRVRLDLDQREVLSEVFGVSFGAPSQRRTKITVTLPTALASYDRLVQLHRTFDDRGRGGATQIADEGGVHVYTGATAEARPRVEAALRKAGYRFTEAPETFVSDDAPPCASATGKTAPE